MTFDVILIEENKINILCLQEVKIETGFDPDTLRLKNYQFELEKNTLKSRTGIYISNCVQYRRMEQLEGVNSNNGIIDLKGCRSVNRLINIYRSFNPQDNVNARAKFKYQLELIKNAMTSKCVIVGDFNMDYAKIYDDNYNNKNLFQDFDDILSDFNLIQVVKFETWSRMVGTERRSSILDHIYI